MSEGEWWCPECKVALHWSGATYEERCVVCGARVIGAGSEAATEIRRLKEEVEGRIEAETQLVREIDRLKLENNRLKDKLNKFASLILEVATLLEIKPEEAEDD